MDFKELTNKQTAFCHEYVIDWNATRAAKEAGYSEDSAKEIGCENLTKPNVKAYIEHIQEDMKKLCGISVVGMVNKLKDIIDDAEKDSDKNKSIEIIAKMLGLNEPDKSETKVEGNITNEPTKITFSKKS